MVLYISNNKLTFVKVLDQSQSMEDIPEWFCGARLNFAENLLRYDDDKVALYTTGIKSMFSLHPVIYNS